MTFRITHNCNVLRRLSNTLVQTSWPVRCPSRTMAYSYGRTRKRQLPVNTVIKFVPQQEAWVIERFGKFNRILEPGLAILLPVIDEIKYVQSLKEVAIEIPSQSAITLDNVTLHLDGVLYLRVIDPFKASYGVEDPEFAVTQLAQTTMRSELGKISLDNVFQEREQLNHNIVEAINHAAEVWGIRCLRYEIRDIQLPNTVVEAMQMQVEAERKKRANVLQSEDVPPQPNSQPDGVMLPLYAAWIPVHSWGNILPSWDQLFEAWLALTIGVREAAINVAEGKKQSQILASEARKMEQINIATGEANAIIARAQARAEGIKKVSLSLQEQNIFATRVVEVKHNSFVHTIDTFIELGEKAASLNVAELYVSAFSNLAKTNNTVVLPANVGDAASMVAQALAVYGQVTGRPKDEPPAPPSPPKESGSTQGEPGASDVQTGRTDEVGRTRDMSYSAGDLRQVEGSNDRPMRWTPPGEKSPNTPHFTAGASHTRSRDF